MKPDINEIIQKFRYNPSSVKKNYDGKTDVYLAKVSYRYEYFKRILSIALVIVTLALLFSGNLTYNKLYYLAKDVKLAGDYVNSVHDTITYNAGNSQSFATYREGLVVASREKMSIYSAGGRELFSSNHTYGNPKLVSSERYVLLYDVGGKQFSLYNSFSQVNGAVLDYSIYGASLANTGDFALITKGEKYNSIVRVYKQNGDKYDYNFRDGYVTSVSISEDGARLAVALSFAEGSNYRTEIRVYKVGSSDYQMATCTISGIPYEIKIVEGGNIIAVGKNGINVFSSSMALIGEYLSENEIYLYHFGEDNIAIVSSHGARDKTTVLLLNKRGKVEKTHTIDQRALDIALADGYIFVQHLGGFERISTALGTSEKHDIVANEFKMLVYDKNTLIVCGDSYAKFLNFGNK